MKKLIIFLFVLFVFNLFGFSENEMSTLKKVSKENKVPVKSLIQLVKEEQKLDSSFTVTDEKKLKKICDKFNENILSFASKLTLIGMLVVFISLIFIGFLISQIKHFTQNKKPKPKKKDEKVIQTSIGTVKTQEGDLSTNSVVAVITAIHLHLLEVEEKNKMNMNWSRTPVSMWKSVSKAKFPNQDFKMLARR